MSEADIQPEVFDELGKIALIGGGRMGEAIISGLVHGALLGPQALVVVEPSEERRDYLIQTYGIDCVSDGASLHGIQTALFAVKPQVFNEVARNIAANPEFTPTRVISIAAGINTKTMQDLFPHTQIIRVMPNAPLMVSAGMSAVAVAQDTHISEGELVVQLFSLMGEAVLIDEQQMNAATAISGSGPAYFALLVEELARAGKRIGLEEEKAEHLAVQTIIGTAKQLQLTDISPEELRVSVTSPGGTTQAALESFAANDLGGIVEQAVKAAEQRAEELA